MENYAKQEANVEINTATYKHYNLMHYFSFWCFIWFILYRLDIVKDNPFYIYALIFIPSIYMFTNYLKKAENNYKKFIISVWLILVDYVPLIYLTYYKHFQYDLRLIFVNLIVLNVYLFIVFLTLLITKLLYS